MTEKIPLVDTITLLVADDHEILRLGLKTLLRAFPKFSIIAEASNGQSAIEKCREYSPDVILMDIRMPVMDGIEATKKIKEEMPNTHILILTSNDVEEHMFAALAAGADGYCVKEAPVERLCLAIETVKTGGCWLDPQIARVVVKTSVEQAAEKQTDQKPTGKQDIHTPLTERELEVLQMVIDGHSNYAIAEMLNLSIDTVKSHMTHILNKLAVTDRTQAAVKALRQGFLR